MQGDGNGQPALAHLFRNLVQHQPRQQRRKSDSPAMLESEDKLARGIVVQGACRNAVMPGRLGKARCTNRALFGRIAKRPLASGAARRTGNRQVAPARGAQTRLRSKPFAAKRAAGRKKQVSDRDEERMKLHRCPFYRLRRRAAQGSAGG